MKGEKISVNWVTCHRCIPALSLIPPRELTRDPGEDLSTACEELWVIACQIKVCAFVCHGFVFSPLFHEALHTSVGVKVHACLNLMHPL